MIRLLDIVLIVAVAAGALWTYRTKHEAEQSAARVGALRAELARENERIRLLEADWAIAVSPGRLGVLARAFETELALQPIQSHQIVGPGELPAMRPEPQDDQTYAGETDDVTTGSIETLIEREEKR